jgi:hypothetical protein
VAAPVNINAEGEGFSARMAAARQRVIIVDLWTDTNDWAAVCDPRLYPTIGLGYRYGRQPEVFSVASPTAGLMFTNDTMPDKVRFFYAVAPIDGACKANVTWPRRSHATSTHLTPGTHHDLNQEHYERLQQTIASAPLYSPHLQLHLPFGAQLITSAVQFHRQRWHIKIGSTPTTAPAVDG